MANPSTAPFGLRPVRHIDGTPWNGMVEIAYIASGYATALFVGDPLTISATTADRDTTAKYYSMTVAGNATTNPIQGIMTGVVPNPNNLSQQYHPGSTEGYIYFVRTSPSLVFQIRDDGTGTMNKNDIGTNTGLAPGSGGSTITGLSSYVLAGSDTTNSTQAHQLHMVGLSDIADNELSDYAIWDVIVNTCYDATGTRLGVKGA